jgi:uncharacterized membrane protein
MHLDLQWSCLSVFWHRWCSTIVLQYSWCVLLLLYLPLLIAYSKLTLKSWLDFTVITAGTCYGQQRLHVTAMCHFVALLLATAARKGLLLLLSLTDRNTLCGSDLDTSWFFGVLSMAFTFHSAASSRSQQQENSAS